MMYNEPLFVNDRVIKRFRNADRLTMDKSTKMVINFFAVNKFLVKKLTNMYIDVRDLSHMSDNDLCYAQLAIKKYFPKWTEYEIRAGSVILTEAVLGFRDLCSFNKSQIIKGDTDTIEIDEKFSGLLVTTHSFSHTLGESK